jgi:hypothetical protein
LGSRRTNRIHFFRTNTTSAHDFPSGLLVRVPFSSGQWLHTVLCFSARETLNVWKPAPYSDLISPVVDLYYPITAVNVHARFVIRRTISAEHFRRVKTETKFFRLTNDRHVHRKAASYLRFVYSICTKLSSSPIPPRTTYYFPVSELLFHVFDGITLEIVFPLHPQFSIRTASACLCLLYGY